MMKTISRNTALLSLSLLLVFSVSARPKPKEERIPAGGIEKAELHSLSRERASVWVRAILPQAAKGWKQAFTGDVTLWGLPVAMEHPVTAVIQPREGGYEAVFPMDVDLARLPAELISKASSQSVDIAIRGTLTGDAGSKVNINIAGNLRFGTSQVEVLGMNRDAFFSFAGGSLSNLSLKDMEGEVRLHLFNPLSSDLGVKELRYTLTAEGRVLAQGSRSGIKLHARRENLVSVPVTVTHSDLVAVAGTTFRNKGTIAGVLSGTVVVKTGTDVVNLNFSAPGTLQLIP